MSGMITADDRRLFAPEVVQTSAMDCGPAALKCLLEGFGLAVDYGRLREACQTDVDGTSIDTLEDVARQLGLVTQQVLTPLDHLLLPAAQLLPALVVTVQPSGITHFVVVWRTLGPWVQIMDPAIGRRWLSQTQFTQEIYRHQLVLPAAEWRAWASAPGFCAPLRDRLRDLDLAEAQINKLLAQALADPTWRSLAALDAVTRLVAAVVKARGLLRGPATVQLVEQFFAQAAQPTAGAGELIPAAFWSVQPLPTAAAETAARPELLMVQGAVALAVSGRQPLVAARDAVAPTTAAASDQPLLSPDLAAALVTPAQPIWAIFDALRADGLLTPTVVVLAVVLAALSVTLEAALLRSLMEVHGWLVGTISPTLLAVGILCFGATLFLLEAPLTSLLRRLGRRVETRLRIALLSKLPRLRDRYFHSRLIADMAHRAYSLRQLHSLPALAVNGLRQGVQLLLTIAGVIWLAPNGATIALTTLLLTMTVALFSQSLLNERDLRVRTQAGALSRFYLDALLGLLPIRAHSAERAMRREHELLLVEWLRASRGLMNLELLLQAVVALVSMGSAGWIVLRYVTGGGEASGVLLLLYWALNLPALGQAFITSAQQYPTVRNHLLRLLEPLGAPTEDDTTPSTQVDNSTQDDKVKTVAEPSITSTPLPAAAAQPGVAIALENVTVVAGGHPILSEITLTIAPGEQVAIVGSSGAGKSSLVGLLLGWQRPAIGQVRVDGTSLVGAHLHALRRVTAWVDPTVQLWNRTVAANLYYGLAEGEPPPLDDVLAAAGLYPLLEQLPAGLATQLGESGGLVSGGEGQRVRLGRAFLRPDVRLAILDEPFRGLDRQQRQKLLASARRQWPTATLLCITHDLAETQTFDRVLVIAGGRLVEDGAPQALAAQPNSHYHALLAADRAVQETIWGAADWQRLWLAAGEVRTI